MVGTRRGREKTVKCDDPKGENENESGKEIVDYEQSRAQRIKQNMDRMKSLGILDLSKKLKPEFKRQIAKSLYQKKKPARDDPPRRSTRLQEMPQVSYFEKKGIPVKNVEIHIEKGENAEIYTEEQEKLLGDSKIPWTLSFGGKRCHQCRQKTQGHRTECSKCKIGTGQFCGECLYTRYGENVTEVNQNPNWVCPVCRGICNCNRCRREKGWAPTGNIYRKVERLGFRSVAHYLIQTFRNNATLVGPAGEIPISASQSISIEDKKAGIDDEKDGMEDINRYQDSDEDYSGEEDEDEDEDDDDNVDS